jgi:mycothiol synthase
MKMNLFKRMFRSEDDYCRLRAFLQKTLLLNHLQEINWQVARLDYWRYFGNPHIEQYALSDVICVWEDDNGEIAAFFVPENRGEVHLQMHPDFRTQALEAEMILTAEEHVAEYDVSGQRRLTVWAHQYDDCLKEVLQRLGYQLGDWPEHQFRQSLTRKIRTVYPPSGYSIRSLGGMSELPARSWLSWRVFHPDETDENYGGWEWYLSVQSCPLYRQELDLVAAASDGELAAFCTVWYDKLTRMGYFEPVGTSPEHRRRGLGKAILTEGLWRLQHLGASYVTVAGYTEPALSLYKAVMLPGEILYERWHKTF